jgi:hypothetical protein
MHTRSAAKLKHDIFSKIVFESDRDGNREIYIINADGTGVPDYKSL